MGALSEDIATFAAGFLSSSLDSLVEEMKATRERSLQELKQKNAERLVEMKGEIDTGRAKAIKRMELDYKSNETARKQKAEQVKDQTKRTRQLSDKLSEERGKWFQRFLDGESTLDTIPGYRKDKEGRWVSTETNTILNKRDAAYLQADYVLQSEEAKKVADKNRALKDLAASVMKEDQKAVDFIGTLKPEDQLKVDTFMNEMKGNNGMGAAPIAKSPETPSALSGPMKEKMMGKVPYNSTMLGMGM